MLTSLAATLILGSNVTATTKGVVVCDEPLAAEVGAEILRKGGNAVDAAVGVAFALAVVEPTAGNIGGGGFMLVCMADGRRAFLDYRETAPKQASRDMYVDASGKLVPFASTVGPRAAGIPGTVAGMGEASKRFGKLPWKDLVQPAFKLASDGFAISGSQANALKSDYKRLGAFASTASEYFSTTGPYSSGERLSLPDLAATLGRIRDKGWREFYTGQTAVLIAKHMREHGGLIDKADLAGYRVKMRKPLVGTYRGREIITSPPPSSGGACLLEMLNILEGYPSQMEPGLHAHLVVEAMKRAFVDRSELMGDPDFVNVPVARLIDKEYARKLRAGIDPEKATSSRDLKSGGQVVPEKKETTHFGVVDAEGNAVSNTYTLNGSFGCGDTVTGAGFLLNNEMDDFAAKPGTANMFGLIQGERNAIAPGKRPLSSMTPTIVLKDGKLEMVLGSPGGPTIINTVLEVLLYKADFGLSPEIAVQLGRFHHQWMPDSVSSENFPADVVEALRKRGQKVSVGGRQGIANCIFIDPKTGVRTGVADKRYPEATAAKE